jgi:hypothetical protein
MQQFFEEFLPLALIVYYARVVDIQALLAATILLEGVLRANQTLN